jgi:hypothetical protein
VLLWNVHMKDEAERKKFRSDLGRKGVYPLCFLKSVEVIDSRSVADMQKIGVGKMFDICGLEEIVVRKCLRMAEVSWAAWAEASGIARQKGRASGQGDAFLLR